MKLFKRRAKPDSVPDEAVKPGDDAERHGAIDRAGDDSPSSPAVEPQPSPGMFQRLRVGLSRSRHQFSEGLATLVLGKKQLDPDLLEALEEQLIMADLGLEATSSVLESLRQRFQHATRGIAKIWPPLKR